ncbi:MAG: hypothetical protein PHI37_00515 [Candidatus Gracilibacteria bacterium]|nr:hypothetical protein [Candidatus Gracilibacteria bacterium]
MKKLSFIFLLFFTTISQIQAFNSFNLEVSQRFGENEGETYLSPLIIDLGNIETNKLSFFINENDYFIFGNDFSKITNSRQDVSIKETQTLNGNKVLNFDFENSFSGTIKLSGVFIRTYNERITGAKIGIDYNSDGKIDSYSKNVVELDKNGRYNDNMKPLAVGNVEYNLTNTGKTIEINFKHGVDLDNNGTFITITKNNEYSYFYEQFIPKISTGSFVYHKLDLENNTYEIKLFSKDDYYLNDDFFIIKLSKDDLVLDKTQTVSLTNTGTVINTSTGETISQTGIITNTGEIILDKQEMIIDKILPIFKTKSFNDFMIKFDNRLDKREYKKEVRVVRNEIIQLLKDYEDKKITKTFVKSELKRLSIEFKKVW